MLRHSLRAFSILSQITTPRLLLKLPPSQLQKTNNAEWKTCAEVLVGPFFFGFLEGGMEMFGEVGGPVRTFRRPADESSYAYP